MVFARFSPEWVDHGEGGNRAPRRKARREPSAKTEGEGGNRALRRKARAGLSPKTEGGGFSYRVPKLLEQEKDDVRSASATGDGIGLPWRW